MGKGAVPKGGWRSWLNRFNLCSLVRLITIYKYISGRNENEVRFKSKEIKRQSTYKYFSSRCEKVFPKSSCFSCGDRKPELLLCKLTDFILWLPVAGEFCNWWFRMFISAFNLRDLCISLIIAPWDNLCSSHSTDGGKMRWWDLPDAIHEKRGRGTELASEVILVLFQPIGNSAWLLEVLVMQWEKCNRRTWVTDLNF